MLAKAAPEATPTQPTSSDGATGDKKPPTVAVLSANLREKLPGVQPYTVKEYPIGDGGSEGRTASADVLRVGIFGLLGNDAAFASRANRNGEATFVGYDDDNESREPETMFSLVCLPPVCPVEIPLSNRESAREHRSTPSVFSRGGTCLPPRKHICQHTDRERERERERRARILLQVTYAVHRITEGWNARGCTCLDAVRWCDGGLIMLTFVQ